MEKRVIMGCDHAGYPLKIDLLSFLREKGVEVEDVGTHSTTSCDYPVFAKKLCERVLEDDGIVGILICGSGIGMSMAANRFKGIRAALCMNEYMARMSRRHNNANILCLGARILGIDVAKAIVEVFLEETFEGDRHLRRINLMDSQLD